jgi:hypothetical protein
VLPQNALTLSASASSRPCCRCAPFSRRWIASTLRSLSSSTLRAMPFPVPPVLIAISGYGRDSDRALAREAGFDHHLVKPADPAELQRLLAGT